VILLAFFSARVFSVCQVCTACWVPSKKLRVTEAPGSLLCCRLVTAVIHECVSCSLDRWFVLVTMEKRNCVLYVRIYSIPGVFIPVAVHCMEALCKKSCQRCFVMPVQSHIALELVPLCLWVSGIVSLHQRVGYCSGNDAVLYARCLLTSFESRLSYRLPWSGFSRYFRSLIMETVSISETSINVGGNTRRKICP
jgi:hypothetical protein